MTVHTRYCSKIENETRPREFWTARDKLLVASTDNKKKTVRLQNKKVLVTAKQIEKIYWTTKQKENGELHDQTSNNKHF